MKITVTKPKPSSVKFGSVNVGDGFSYKNEFYIRINLTTDPQGVMRNVLNLEDFTVYYLAPTDEITLVEAELIINLFEEQYARSLR